MALCTWLSIKNIQKPKIKLRAISGILQTSKQVMDPEHVRACSNDPWFITPIRVISEEKHLSTCSVLSLGLAPRCLFLVPQLTIFDHGICDWMHAIYVSGGCWKWFQTYLLPTNDSSALNDPRPAVEGLPEWQQQAGWSACNAKPRLLERVWYCTWNC